MGGESDFAFQRRKLRILGMVVVVVLGSSVDISAAQFHLSPPPPLEVFKCSDSPLRLRDNHSPWRIEVPSYLFGQNLTLMQSNQNFHGCESEPTKMAQVSYFFTEHLTPGDPLDGDTRMELMDLVYLTPQGVLAVDHAMYRRDEYCLYDYTHGTTRTQPQLVFKICPFNCSKDSKGSRSKSDPKTPCVPKCCPVGMAVDFTSEFPECLPSSGTREVWGGKFYDSKTWRRLSPLEEDRIRPHYHHHVLHNCTKVETWFGKTVTQMGVTHQRQASNLLSDGSVIYISGKRRWELLEGVDFCIDGMQIDESGESNGGERHPAPTPGQSELSPWPESDQVLILCVSDFQPPQSKTLSALYMWFLYIAAFFHFMTALVHGLLWEKQNSNGWSMLCLTGSMSIWCVLMGNAHFLGLYGGHALRNAGACVANAILAHFFFLAGFTWLTLINYSIWTTFRTLTPRQDAKNLKQFLYFVIMGFGGPLIVVLVGVTLEHLFPDKESLVLIPEYGHNICFVADYAQGVYIYYILAVLFLIIFTLFGATCFKLYQFSQDTAKVRSSSSAGDRSMALLYAKLSIVLGITWVFEFVSWAVTSDGHGQLWIWAIPDIYNLITSFFIFLIYVCKPSTMQQLEQKFPRFKPVTQAVGKVVAVAWEKVTFQSEPPSNVTGTSSLYQPHSSSGAGSRNNLHLQSTSSSKL